MKILFVVKDIDYIDPIGLMMISASAKSRGHETFLGILAREDILRRVDELKPQVVAYSASTGEHKYYLEINPLIKARFKDVFTIMGGAHATFYPECVKTGALDAVCVGEGEDAFLDVLDALENVRGVDGIKNIATPGGENSGVRDLVEDLDTLPFPDRELFYENTEMGRFPLKSFIASRGCPYSCTYCFNHAFCRLYRGKGRPVRRHSVEHVIEEIERVKSRYPLGFVKFYDDIFVHRADAWLEEFVGKYKARVNLPFHCLTRADLITEDAAALLAEAGCRSISMSIEAGNPKIRNEVLKRNMTDEQIIKGFDICRRHGIKTFSNSIVGLPYATIENEIETIDLNIKCRVTFAEFPIFHPYPGTELGDYCIKEGISDTGYESLHMSYMNKSPLSCFTEREKTIQRNISRLGGLVIWFPFLRGIVMKGLIKLPYNTLFFLCYYLQKAYLVHWKIYPFRMGLKDFWGLFIKSLNLESFKLSDEQKGTC